MLDGVETNVLEGRLPSNALSNDGSFDDHLKSRISNERKSEMGS